MNLDMSNPPNSRTKDFFASPALSLSLAGVFRGATGAVEEVEEGDEESGGGREEAVDISSENTGPGRSDEDADAMELQEEEVDERGKKKRKKYHRHTAEQIREMETLFKESPHPDEKQRQQLSKKLGLNPRQVKFWFQNRRTQIKAIQERHENSLLKTEMEKLREENKCMRQTIKKACCPNCGFATSNKDSTMMTTEEQQLRIENARLKAEVEKLRTTIGKFPGGTTSPSSSCSGGNDQENRSSLDFYTGFFGLEKSRISEIANQAMNELTKMATAGDPLWVRSVETGREILNYDEYAREFLPEGSSSGGGRIKRSIEVSRETGVVFLDMPRLVQAFMDVNQWKEMFSCMVAKAATVDVISNGEGDNRNCAIQLMFAELQMLTPMVTAREVYFIRQCKQLSPDSWAIVDVSIDRVEDNTDTSVGKCRKRPSGCIIQDKCNGHCKVIWVEHLECQKATVHTLYRSLVNSGLAFGAKHWMATLQLQCERLVFFMATNVPTKDSSGIATLAGRKSVLKLAQRMTSSFSRAIGASSYHTWAKISTKGGDGIKVASRRNMNDPGEPQGLILCAVSSIWLPVSPHALFDFLRDDARWNEWDIMLTGGQVQTIANLAKGQDRGNSVTLHATKSKETNLWILQDSCTNAFESMVVRAAVDIPGMQSVMTGVDSSNIAILSSGFSILPDGLETRPLVISSRPEERSMEGGSLLTVAFQILANPSPTAKLTTESMETTNTLISCTMQNIKTSLQCEDS
ncbi:homeobox-leucine zipper protein GLABRA 2 [Cinnamomum micranthum f. kanehirae]|uniref:Homeobox-leucine zipper protein GLABRA 2 n=1 Tax=Cinnamomum micranthum f. kanehirae TaxID=337451 RepID=A0A3S3NQX4_9MAGN|nr:homeobox-leucine zipper protein GLABRA 2 [Cinnamomum micranthum f. kanehirae]